MSVPRLALACVAALLLAAAPPVSQEEMQVQAVFQAVQEAVEARDAARLRELVHPRFEMLHAFGQVDEFDIWLKLVAGGKLPRQTADIREYDRRVTRVGDTAVRSSIVRFRDAKSKRDTWLRGSTVFVREGGRWRELRHQSALLYEAPSVDAVGLSDYLGAYAIPERDGFRLTEQDGLLHLVWTTGARLPLVPIGPDRFGVGPLSTMTFARNGAGAVVSVTRADTERTWWTATRQ
ncbi:nuclear transport factor 2 family protein [Sphingosinicella sp. BN140058]|uniref:nuclear transport factor 2 family protein n=1 Tax=Sphingosinicella sp. BN140058 TaxID=1892855 RepID=UPI001011A6B9|nr:nuclear transport factor 2 family protein [Sphingosinicella sp. BN140058]QAY77989.1 nuclear transport factor 2 family protein [Sphingosinicella sp. BN140058]